MLFWSINLILILSLILVFICWLFGKFNVLIAQKLLLSLVILSFFLSVTLLLVLDQTVCSFQEITFYFFNVGTFLFLNIAFGVDGISIFFIVLTAGLTPMCILLSYKYKFKYVIDYWFFFILLEIFLILAFTALDIITFFFFFESILIPMFFIIGIWGSRNRRVRATFLLFIYTMAGSIMLLAATLIIYSDVGTTNFSLLSTVSLDFSKTDLLWLLIFLSFSIKIPTIPFHIWLPEAHVEAPTGGSVILAGLLLKLGGYGFLRILLPIFSESTFQYLPLVDTLALVSIIYASLTTIRQVDLKRIIAYSSVAHMNLVVLGLFSVNLVGILGGIFLMIAHGIVASALFFCIGVLYDRYASRLLFYYGGLVNTMPLFSFLLLIFSLANTGLPTTVNFIGELVIFIGLIDHNTVVLFISISSVVFSVLYTVFMFNRLVFGNTNGQYITSFIDINARELFTLGSLAFLTIFLGICPNFIFQNIEASTSLLVEKLKWIH